MSHAHDCTSDCLGGRADFAGVRPGRPLDMLARLMGQWLSERLGQQFVIENRPGAATNIATEAVVKARPWDTPARIFGR